MIVEIVWVAAHGVGENGNRGLKTVSNEGAFTLSAVYLHAQVVVSHKQLSPH